MFNPDAESQQPNLYEHLAEGYRPIMACVGTKREYGEDISAIRDIEAVGHGVDFFADPKDLKARGSKSGKFMSHVISRIDEKPKSTKMLSSCTTLIAVGRDKETGEEISFLTHQLANRGSSKEDLFVRDLEESLEELKARCQEGSIDIVIAGGGLGVLSKHYKNSLENLSSAVQRKIGFEPLVICGPKDNDSDDVYLDTENRRLFIERPEDSNLHNEVFKPSKLSEMRDKWEAEEKERKEKQEM